MLSQIVRQRSAASQARLLQGRSLLQSPAKLRHHSQSSRLSSLQSSVGNASQENRPRRPSFQSSRSLATVVEQSAVGEYPYFENEPYAPGSVNEEPWNQESRRAPRRFEPSDPSSLVIVPEFIHTTPKVMRKRRGIGGDEQEMLANFQLSVKVAQFERASKILNRLKEYYPVNSSSYLALHNRLLESMVCHAIDGGKLQIVLQIQRWFEVDMPTGGVTPDATTYAIMIRMALRLLKQYQRDRAVRRYWALAKKAGVEEEVLAVPILLENELGRLSEICSADLQRVAIDSMEFRRSQDSGPPIPDIAPVRPVNQKGLGLSSLQESIAMFSSAIVPVKADSDSVESTELYNRRRQEQLERDVMTSALKRWEIETEKFEKMAPTTQVLSKQVGPLMHIWKGELVKRIEAELELVDEAEKNPVRTPEQKDRCEYGVFLRVFPPERLAAITILTVMGSLIRHGLDSGMKLSVLVSAIGHDMYDELLAENALDNMKKFGASQGRLNNIKKMLHKRKVTGARGKWLSLIEKMEKADPTMVWSASSKAKVGAVLMGFLFEVAKVNVYNESDHGMTEFQQLAFQHSYQISWGKRVGFIYAHPELVKLVTRQPSLELLGRRLPMVCKPRRWTALDEGGFLTHRDSLLRQTPGEVLQPKYVKAAMERHGLEEIREGLDVLGTTGWHINRDVFNIMLEAWNTGDPVADLAPLEPDMPLPPKPSSEEGFNEMRLWNERVREIENKRSGYHSQRCFQNFQLEVARSYLNETFYFPHNLDFRGRAYPLPPYLNQMGADNARGLLLFSEAKPLGERGLRWLKIQIANLAGFDKASLSEREQFTMDNLDDVLDSANNGLHGRRWWLKAEDPWQCLAACCELRNALDHPDPTKYPSRLPIHQDGSCNGLQHYAALGGDREGAQQVNLEPSDRPSDVYSGVADFVKEVIAKEAAEGDPIAKLLQGKITRKIVKQTVMTNVYGVTFMGAMKQVKKQLLDYYPEFSTDQTLAASQYIAKRIFDALGSMFNGAHAIQYWLGDCANRITQSLSPFQIEAISRNIMENQGKTKKDLDPTKEFKSTVIWTTPLGLPVVQPYRTRVAKRVQTSFQSLSIIEPNSNFLVSRRKQLQAFPPNFIHSLDATHMMLSAIACREAGLSFSAVHDSFWTHAADVDSMNRILRDEFVRMHSDDVIKRLAEEFQVRYGRNLYFAKVPASSKFGVAIRKHRGGKANALTRELLAEYQRQELLQSRDPERVLKGQEMVTPASIFEMLGGTDDDLSIRASHGQSARLGEIPDDLDAVKKSLEKDDLDPLLESLLPGGLDKSLPSEAGFDETADLEVENDTTAELNGAGDPKKKRKYQEHQIWLWMPMRFREVPQKGSWDLTRIRESEYFFS
ncbi:hypothetical protein BJY01DRAFT_215842 [Aspergillus pseudoustus]|uniref:DNA-directed RNA polymerase n=1 Tax=Aspergillus pseudoustus TaxID=1810923 RepID=A0ABR4JTC2_9EURO